MTGVAKAGRTAVRPYKRKRAVGGGRKATLRTPQEKLFYILLYCKCYPTFDLLSILFDFERSCAWDWVHGLLPVLEQTLGYKQALPERKLRSMEEFLERFPDVQEVIVDGTERPVQQRQKSSDQQKQLYSGKKKAESCRVVELLSGCSITWRKIRKLRP